jgi:hypothetical protein
LQQPSQSPPTHKLSRKDLFGCLRGQITMAEDFNAPLSDFAEGQAGKRFDRFKM